MFTSIRPSRIEGSYIPRIKNLALHLEALSLYSARFVFEAYCRNIIASLTDFLWRNDWSCKKSAIFSHSFYEVVLHEYVQPVSRSARTDRQPKHSKGRRGEDRYCCVFKVRINGGLASISSSLESLARFQCVYAYYLDVSDDAKIDKVDVVIRVPKLSR